MKFKLIALTKKCQALKVQKQTYKAMLAKNCYLRSYNLMGTFCS